MKTFAALLVALGIVVAPLHAHAAAVRAPAAAPSILEAAGIAAASGAYRAQNTPDITTGGIREGDKKRSALAFALSGALAFAGAGLWRWLPCREKAGTSSIGGLQIEGYDKCYDQDGQRLGLDTPTKALLGAGVALELVSLGYLIAHLRSDEN